MTSKIEPCVGDTVRATDEYGDYAMFQVHRIDPDGTLVSKGGIEAHEDADMIEVVSGARMIMCSENETFTNGLPGETVVWFNGEESEAHLAHNLVPGPGTWLVTFYV